MIHLLELYVVVVLSLLAELALMTIALYTVLIMGWKQGDTARVSV